MSFRYRQVSLLQDYTYLFCIQCSYRDLLQPADEVAEDALEAYQEESKGDDGEDGQSGELDNQDG